ncbi:MAG: acyl-CoA dehydratase activase [Bacillota bacterium]|nr:acyl-CoA dehydratase activase [Bacillota bacterium]
MTHYIGIDIGSTCAKTVVMDENRNILYCLLQPTGWSSVDTAESINAQLSELGITPGNSVSVATGYGRVSVPFANKCVTEITCHGKGACFIHGMNSLTVIDIGGQDTKLIAVENGMVKDFVMNDKCSAGTGRFLEVMANTLAVRPDELCELASHGGNTSISSMCTVFAESEIISLIGRGEQKENIAYAVIDSIAKKVASQASRLQYASSAICLTGGLCGFSYLRSSLSSLLGAPVLAGQNGRYAGAIGAALCAAAVGK